MADASEVVTMRVGMSTRVWTVVSVLGMKVEVFTTIELLEVSPDGEVMVSVSQEAGEL